MLFQQKDFNPVEIVRGEGSMVEEFLQTKKTNQGADDGHDDNTKATNHEVEYQAFVDASCFPDANTTRGCIIKSR